MIIMLHGDLLGSILAALSSAKRIEAFELLSQNKNLPHIAETIKTSRSGFQRYLDSFVDAGLLDRKRRGSYEVSQMGTAFLAMIKIFDRKMDELRKKEAKIRVLEAVRAYGAELTDKDIKDILTEISDSLRD